jgi:hypothetical protein
MEATRLHNSTVADLPGMLVDSRALQPTKEAGQKLSKTGASGWALGPSWDLGNKLSQLMLRANKMSVTYEGMKRCRETKVR